MKRKFHLRQSGISLIELMISIGLGLVILAGMSVIFMSNNKSRVELEKTSRQIESGRYAMQLLSDDLQMAGFLGAYVPPTTAPGLTSLPEPCSTDLGIIRDARVLHVQGYNDYDNPSTVLPCLSDVKAGTDVLVVRRAGTCAVGETGCDAFLSGAPHIQVSGCPTDSVPYKIDSLQPNLNLMRIGCTATGEIRRYRTHIYFVANNNVSGDGIPTLKRAELGTSMSIVPLVDGIDNVQFEYGIDTDGDGTPNVYTVDPGSYNTCGGADCVQNWWNVMAVKVHLLARNTQATTGYTETKTYTLGLKANGDPNTVTPSDSFKRHEYSATVRLANAAGRRP